LGSEADVKSGAVGTAGRAKPLMVAGLELELEALGLDMMIGFRCFFLVSS